MSCTGYTGIETPAREVSIWDVNEDEAYESVLTNDCESGTDFEVTRTKRSLARGIAVGLGVTAVVAVVVCGALYQAGGLPSRSSMNGVVGFYADVAPWIKPKPAVCNQGIVLDICLRLNKQPPGYFGGNPNSPKAVVSVSLLADYFMASKDSITSYLKKIGAWNVGKADDYTVKCQELCDKTMASFPAGAIPQMVDVGCYNKPPGLSPTCSVDVAINVLMHTEFPKGSRYKLAHQFLDEDVKVTDDMKDEVKIFDDLMSQDDVARYMELSHPDVSFDVLQREAARLFRVFPAPKTVSADIWTDWAPEKDRRLQFDDSCAAANSGECDVPNSCEDGTDCTDCGDCNGKVPDDSCHYSKDDECDEIRYCMVGTDCTDCDTCGLGGEELAEKLKKMTPNDSCASAGDGTCDSSCAEGTDCTDCGTCKTGGLHFAPPQYPDLVFRAGTKVQALLMAAHLGLAAGEGPEVMTTYIGKDTDAIRDEIKRMTMGLSRMLDNINYVYPGPECKEDTYAYVDTEKSPDATGKYTMNLCKSYMDGNYLVQYSSLIAAGIRAKNMLANTATLNGSPVIGADAVKELALKCKTEGGDACGQSVRNAQSIVHVINKFLKQAL